MALSTLPASNTVVAAAAATVDVGSALDFRGRVNAAIYALDNKAQAAQAMLEALCLQLGAGAVAGGTIAAGAGLQVTIGTLAAIVGNPVIVNTPSTVSVVASSTAYLYLRQDGAITASTVAAVPGTVDGHGTALLWGKAITNTTAVVSVDNTRIMAGRAGAGVMPPATVSVSGSVALTVDQAAPDQIVFTGAGVGTVYVPVLQAGRQWACDNQSAGTVAIKGFTGTGISIANAKAAVVYCDGVNVRRLTPDT